MLLGAIGHLPGCFFPPPPMRGKAIDHDVSECSKKICRQTVKVMVINQKVHKDMVLVLAVLVL